MSKVQEAAEKLKRHQFWILCGVVAVFALLSWYLSTSSMAETYAKNKTKIDGYVATIGTVTETTEHPNGKWLSSVEEKKTAQSVQAKAAWDALFAAQKKNVYVWPRDLNKEVVDAFNRDTPPAPRSVNVSLLSRYQTFVKSEFERLAKIVDAEWHDPLITPADRVARENRLTPTVKDGGRSAAVVIDPHPVRWENQVELQQGYNWPQRPTELQVWYAQEDIWTLEAICQAIAATNAGSTGAHDAAVKVIEEMKVGFWAAEETPSGMGENRITRVKTVAAPATTPEAAATDATGVLSGGKLTRPLRPDLDNISTSSSSTGREEKSSSGGDGGGDSGSVTTEPVKLSLDDQLQTWRYVDRKGKPLTKVELTSAPPFQEFRLLPWQLRVKLDQRKFDEFLVAFRNTAMPLEIRQVRINPPLGANTPYSNERSSNSTVPTSGSTVTVELRGIAYLINPPADKKIGVGAPADGAADGGSPAVAESTAPPTPGNGTETATPATTPPDTNGAATDGATIPAPPVTGR